MRCLWLVGFAAEEEEWAMVGVAPPRNRTR